MLDGLASIATQAFQAGVIPSQSDKTWPGHRQNSPGDTSEDACVARQNCRNKSDNSGICPSGHRDRLDARFCRDSPKHSKKANGRAQAATEMRHPGDAPGLPTHLAACVIYGETHFLMTLWIDDDCTCHMACWRAAFAAENDGD